MFRRRFVMAACGALALLLTATEASHAQIFFGGRGGAFFWPWISYPVSPTYYGYPHPYIYNPPPTAYNTFSQYSMIAPTNFYYGAATPMYYGASYSPGYYGAAPVYSPLPGGGVRAASAVSPAAYTTPTYPIQSPNYNTNYPVSPPISAVTDNSAEVDVRLPADADLWFEGHKTAQTGTDRSFRSPELEPGQDYVYEVHARWAADGKPVDDTRKVSVHAGDHVVVNFTQPAK